MSKHCGDTLPGVEVKDADVFIGAAGSHILTRGIDLNLSDINTRVLQFLKCTFR